MECAYYFVDGTWNVPTTLTFLGGVHSQYRERLILHPSLGFWTLLDLTSVAASMDACTL
jgi:hypothetical protein